MLPRMTDSADDNLYQLEDSKLLWVRRYEARGIPMVALYGLRAGDVARGEPALICACNKGVACPAAGKHPVRPGWQKDPAMREADIMPQLVGGEPRNLGIAMGHGLVVLDVDGEEGRRSLEALWEEFGQWQDGPMQITGSGGMHFLFKTRVGEDFINRVKLRPGLDVRSGRSQIVTAPSRHRSGECYRWHAWDLEIPELPGWLRALFKGDRPGAKLAAVAGKGEIVIPVVPQLPEAALVKALESKERAIQYQGGNAKMMSVMGYLVRTGGVRLPEVMLRVIEGWNARCEPEWPEDQLLRGFRSVLKEVVDTEVREAENAAMIAAEEEETDPSELVPMEMIKGKVVVDRHGWRRILDQDPRYAGRIKKDLRRNVVTWDGIVLNEAKLHALHSHMERRYGARGTTVPVFEASFRSFIDDVQVDPVRVYLDGLVWDGVERLNTVVEHVLGAQPTALNVSMVRRWFISAVARVMEPGCKVDTVLILKGAQGLRKSTFFSALAWPWFTDSPPDLMSKDRFLFTRPWISEWAELAAFGRREQDTVKAFLSSAVDIYRAAYAREEQEHPRRGVIVGTTNSDSPLTDLTGSRRFWVLEVTHLIDTNTLRTHRDQLWAEAVICHKLGEKWYLSAEEDAALAAVNAEHHSVAPDPVFEAACDILEKVAKRVNPAERMTSTIEILTQILYPDEGYSLVKKATQVDVGRYSNLIERARKKMKFNKHRDTQGRYLVHPTWRS